MGEGSEINMATPYKFKRHDRVSLVGEEKAVGVIYDIVPKDRNDDPNYYYVQWDKTGRYMYSEDMLELEPKGK